MRLWSFKFQEYILISEKRKFPNLGTVEKNKNQNVCCFKPIFHYLAYVWNRL